MLRCEGDYIDAMTDSSTSHSCSLYKIITTYHTSQVFAQEFACEQIEKLEKLADNIKEVRGTVLSKLNRIPQLSFHTKKSPTF